MPKQTIPAQGSSVFTEETDIQNQSVERLYYQEGIYQEGDGPDFLTNSGFILKPTEVFGFKKSISDDPNLKCFVYNPHGIQLNIFVD